MQLTTQTKACLTTPIDSEACFRARLDSDILLATSNAKQIVVETLFFIF